MGDGKSDAGYISFLVCRLRKSSFGLMFWCDFGICFGICSSICFGDFSIRTYVYVCKYYHELSYKAPISGMSVMSL